ncbi:hypothetical protein E1B28_004533 [Marasmius oreades]|uniref:Uncharacterized protein n=1 Tax=Marasmius oreades TaxID=181124 RepID=A0A9P8ADB6_9AGAR|nr:uncharacterized protein E1B28_004533 [Marasmius oreades]KAG7097155.1 hypothetical protein E1B28_004533 [Marasmius oreades]
MSTRSRREEDANQAYDIQVKAGVQGAARASAVGIGLTIILHYTWPTFRRLRTPFKAFVVSGFAMAGLTFGAERALLAHESKRREEENALRRQARLELAQRGIIPTETEITKWRVEREQQMSALNEG